MSEKERWVRMRNALGVSGATGLVRRALAREVYRAVFSSSSLAGGATIGSPALDLPDLKFSRVPAEAALRLTVNEQGAAECQLGLVAEGIFYIATETDDQLICGDRWFPVDTESLSATVEWLDANGVRLGSSLTLRQLVAIRQADQKSFRLIEDSQPTVHSSTAESPELHIAGLEATLYPYQQTGAAFLRQISDQSGGCLLADEMGLGKTLQVIALLQSEKNQKRGISLVIVPATVLENWRRELERFAPGLRVLIHKGASRAGVPAVLEAFDVIVSSYDTVTRDEPILSTIAWNVIALDEAQQIKNPTAQRTLAVKRLPRRVSIAVTGTPVENRLEDLWSISDFFLPELLGDLASFRSAFGDTVEDARILGALVAPTILRRNVKDVAKDLPELIEVPQPLEMSPAMIDLYEETRLANSSAPGQQLAVLTRLRQLCAHPSLITDWHGSDDDVPKLQRLMELIDEIASRGEKCLIFAGFTDAIDLIMRAVAQRFANSFVEVVDGRTPVDFRQSIVDRYTAFRGSATLVMNPRAAGVGLNITAANHVIHYTPEWNPAVTMQATARSYRRKQERPVTAHYLFYAASVEEVMVEKAQQKRELASGATVGNEGDATQHDIAAALARSPRPQR